MGKLKIALIGGGSRSFGPGTIRDVLRSETLSKFDIEIALMDKVAAHLGENEKFAQKTAEKMGRKIKVSTTTDLSSALDGADAVVTAIEVDRYLYWSQDFHVPRRFGFRQVYGENGGPGGLFHALRNMGPTVEIARTMEKLCPKAPLLNYTNPEPKLCEAVNRLTSTKIIGLCDGVFMGEGVLSGIFGKPGAELDLAACGMNHFTWFQKIRDAKTGEDLYPRLREIDRKMDPIHEWHEMALPRILLRRFGLWPAPASNHYGEYLGWAQEFVASDVQYYYDPMDGPPWKTGVVPEFVYSLTYTDLNRSPEKGKGGQPEKEEEGKGEPDAGHHRPLAIPVIEALVCGEKRFLPGVNVPNRGAIPGIQDDMVVEVPADMDANGVHPRKMDPLPEPVAAVIRQYGSIHKILVEAYAENSKNKLVQALLLEPMTHSYRAAVELVDEMLKLQKDLLPPLQ